MVATDAASSGESERLHALREARGVVLKQTERFGASPVFGFSTHKYFLGVCKSYFTVYIAGQYSEYFWCWHATQVLLLLPMQAYRWHKQKGLAYFVEFCWVMNFFITGYLVVCAFWPHLLSEQVRGSMARLIFAFGCGPLGGAVMLLGNALVPHSVDHTMSLLIHLQPLITAYTLKWDPMPAGTLHPVAGDVLFPLQGPPVSFVEYMSLPLKVYAAYFVLHSSFMVVVGLGLPAKGYKTTYSYNLSPPPGKHNLFTSVLGRAGGGGSEVLRFFKYESISGVLAIANISLTYLMYLHGTRHIQQCFMLFICCVCAWNGANWYSKNLGGFCKSVDKLIKVEEARLGKDNERATSLHESPAAGSKASGAPGRVTELRRRPVA